MIKNIIKLTADIKAQSGQYLILDKFNKIHVVDASIIENLIKQKSEIINKQSRLRKDVLARMIELIKDGLTLSEIRMETGVSVATITRHKKILISRGEIIETGRRNRPHYWYKTPESLNKARSRGTLLGRSTK